MGAAPTRLGWKVAGGVLLVGICAVLFAAYQQPGMLMSFDEIMSFCAALLR
jgi:hypothetical protein